MRRAAADGVILAAAAKHMAAAADGSREGQEQERSMGNGVEGIFTSSSQSLSEMVRHSGKSGNLPASLQCEGVSASSFLAIDVAARLIGVDIEGDCTDVSVTTGPSGRRLAVFGKVSSAADELRISEPT
jgi:hypothetical protein